MSTRVTEKGQVTIPAEIRAAAGIAPGAEIEWGYDPATARIVATKAGFREDQADLEAIKRRIDSVRGTADAGLTTAEILRMTRGYGEDD